MEFEHRYPTTRGIRCPVFRPKIYRALRLPAQEDKNAGLQRVIILPGVQGTKTKMFACDPRRENNTLSPNIHMHILLTVLSIFLMVPLG